jgi:MraZ protein
VQSGERGSNATLAPPPPRPYVVPGFTTLSHFSPLLPTKAGAVASFLGRYDYQLDPKGRVSLPADFRKEADGSRFVLLQWEATHLTLFPQEVWERVQARILELRRTRPAMQQRLRRIAASAAHAEPDKQGRILVPAALARAAGLEGTVAVVGNADRIEIWNPTTFDAVVGSVAPSGDDADLAELEVEIFG